MTLRTFLQKNTGNTTVNNWAVSLEDYQLKFEYIKGVKNNLADTMSCLVNLDPDLMLPPEPQGQEFRKPVCALPKGNGEGDHKTDIIFVMAQDLVQDKDPIKVQDRVPWETSDDELKQAQ